MRKATPTTIIDVPAGQYTPPSIPVYGISCGFDTDHLHFTVDPDDGDCSLFITGSLGGDVQGQVCLDNASARAFAERLLQEVNRHAS